KGLLKETTEFALHGSNAGCKFSIPDDLFPIKADKAQISQVINNLVINAGQAMPEGGAIEIKAENLILGKSQDLPLKEGKYIKISVKDSGIGIPKEEFPRIFDPYFTTKHKGNGLGLTTAYSIIKKHNGHIDVQSELGVGTTFHIYLPAPEKKMSIEKEEAEQILKGEGRILLMDDEEDILESAGGVLRELGYEARTAKDGDEAISLYSQAKKPFDLVIMDLTIPGGMGGKAAIKKLLEIDPRAKVIVSSGYSNDPIMADFKNYGFCGALHKPYKIGEMSRVLHKILES
ncbi:response regulator, partial [bacterium]|nr:response regulator [bacterium]